MNLKLKTSCGTAKLFENNPNVFTFSMHGQHNYPFHKEKSDLDIPLSDGTDDNTHLRILSQTLPMLINDVKPDFCFYQSGVDILETDKFGKLKVTLQGCKQRDEIVLSLVRRHAIPCVVSMRGGYSPDIRNIVEAHCNTFRTALQKFG